MHGVPCRRVVIAIGVAFALLPWTACTTDEPGRPSNLDSMVEAANLLKIKNKNFKVWVADNEPERRRGLMYVTSDEMAPLADGTERGMWFVFPTDQSAAHGFWMKNTIIPLDIAFVRADGRIVTIRTMAPRDERHYYPKAPYRYALEVNANTFSRLGIKEGDSIEIPKSLLKTTS